MDFNRDSMADWYARHHLNTDPGISKIYYLSKGAPEREIRFLEVNSLLTVPDDVLQPIDFGIDTGTTTAHTLYVLDVTPQQLEQIRSGRLALPTGWSLDGAQSYDKGTK